MIVPKNPAPRSPKNNPKPATKIFRLHRPLFADRSNLRLLRSGLTDKEGDQDNRHKGRGGSAKEEEIVVAGKEVACDYRPGDEPEVVPEVEEGEGGLPVLRDGDIRGQGGNGRIDHPHAELRGPHEPG